MYLLIDLETIPRQDIDPPEFDISTVKLGNIKDPVKQEEKIAVERAKFECGLIKKMSVTPELCQIVSLAWMLVGDGGEITKKEISYNENCEGDLNQLMSWQLINMEKWATLITWNGKAFDIPVLWKRHIANGLNTMPLVDYLRFTKKYDMDQHIDLMHLWNNYDFGSMQSCAEFLGIPCKTDFDGSMVYEAWQNGEHDKIKEYNMQDVEVMYQICCKIGIF